jgi:tetratricopeptide (TPR) repeat protein
MDLTTLASIMGFLIAVLGIDTYFHPKDVILETVVVSRSEDGALNVDMLRDILKDEVERISSTPTISTKPAISVGQPTGLAVSIAESLHVPAIAYALQSQFSNQPAMIKLSMFMEGTKVKILVSGSGQWRSDPFRQEVTQEPGESVTSVARRAAIVAMAQVDPYSTALNLMQRHATDLEFGDSESVIGFALARMPPRPIHPERALFENLQGMIALFRRDLPTALALFQKAAASNPDNAVPTMNAAFVKMALDKDQEAIDDIEAMLRRKPPTDRILLATAYLTLGAGWIGLDIFDAAERAVVRSIELHGTSSTAYELWSEIRRDQGDLDGARIRHEQALAVSGFFENYGELAALYFRMAWRDGEPVMRSPFTNPSTVTVRGGAN